MENVYKVVLSSGKEVLLREPKIKHRELAAQAAGAKSGENQFAFVVAMAAEMLRLCIHSIDGKAVSAKDLMDMDAHFSAKEYGQLEKTMRKITSEDDDMGKSEPTLEIVTSTTST